MAWQRGMEGICSRGKDDNDDKGRKEIIHINHEIGGVVVEYKLPFVIAIPD